MSCKRDIESSIENQSQAVTCSQSKHAILCPPVPGVDADAAALRTDSGHVEVCGAIAVPGAPW